VRTPAFPRSRKRAAAPAAIETSGRRPQNGRDPVSVSAELFENSGIAGNSLGFGSSFPAGRGMGKRREIFHEVHRKRVRGSASRGDGAPSRRPPRRWAGFVPNDWQVGTDGQGPVRGPILYKSPSASRVPFSISPDERFESHPSPSTREARRRSVQVAELRARSGPFPGAARS